MTGEATFSIYEDRIEYIHDTGEIGVERFERTENTMTIIIQGQDGEFRYQFNRVS